MATNEQLFTELHSHQVGSPERREVCGRLVHKNMGMVRRIMGRFRFHGVDEDELMSRALDGLWSAIQSFDPKRGYKFSTYGWGGVVWKLRGECVKNARRRLRYQNTLDIVGPNVRCKPLREPKPRINLNDQKFSLTDTEKYILSCRFPLVVGINRSTLKTVGTHLKLTKERVRQIQVKALAKMRGAMEEPDHDHSERRNPQSRRRT